MDAEQILQELQKLPYDRQLTIKGTGAWIVCPNPEHAGGNEHTPSCKVNIGSEYTGRLYCFGCGLKEPWSYLAKLYGLAGIDKNFKAVGVRNTNFRKHKKEIATEEDDEEGFKEQTFSWPKDREWRGIPGKFLTMIEAYVPQVRRVGDKPHVVFPVTMYGEKVGHVRALMEDAPRDPRTGKKTVEQYINAKGTWVEKSFFGFDYCIRKSMKRKPLWLVEGPRDVFKSWMAENRAQGVLGKNFSEQQLEIIRLMNPKVVVLATDNDDAGNLGADNMRDMISPHIPCVRVKFGKGEDIFDQPIAKLRRIDERIREKYC